MIVLFNKPHGVLCQFTDTQDRPNLAQFIDVPNVYPAGRLDRDSEGLLLLTDDGKLQQRVANPRYKLPKTYWAQVEGDPQTGQITALAHGVELKDGRTRPATVRRIEEPTGLWARDPPIRYRRNIPTAWLEVTLREGRNRQVRRMTAAVGLPTLRLIRVRIGDWRLGELAPGQYRIEAPR